VGLAVVKQIVEAHGGQAWAESQTNSGSQFFVALHRGGPTNVKAGLPGEQYA
jgi:signal transduction histidine kinase